MRILVVGASGFVGRHLLAECRERGVDTYHLETWDRFEPRMVAGKQTAGVTAGASTPAWVITDFVQGLEAL